MSNPYNREYFEDRTISNYGGYEDWPQFKERAEYIKKTFNPQTVLDFGCAKGFLVDHLQELGIEAEGIDISEYATSGKTYLKCGDIRELQGKYDLLVSFDVLEHLPEDEIYMYIMAFKRLADKQFHMITTTEYHFGGDKTHICMHDKAWWLDKFKDENALIIHAGEQHIMK